MKLVFALLLMIGLPGIPQQAKNIKISTFKQVPNEMLGCGDAFYLTAKDKKEVAFVCITDFESALLHINGKPVEFKPKHGQLVAGKYTLIIDTSKPVNDDDEHYTMHGSITLKVGDKIVWTSKVIGEGGC